MSQLWFTFYVCAMALLITASAPSDPFIVGNRDPNLTGTTGASRREHAQAQRNLLPSGSYMLEPCGISDEEEGWIDENTGTRLMLQTPPFHDFKIQPAFMVHDPQFRTHVAILREFGALSFLGSYGIHQIAVGNMEATPRKVEEALNLAWEEQIRNGAAALAHSEVSIRPVVIEFDPYRWFTQNGDPVTLVTYSIALMNLTDAPVSLPAKLSILIPPTVERLSDRLGQAKITMHRGPVFRGLWLEKAETFNMTEQIGQLKARFLGACEGAPVGQVQISPGRPFVTKNVSQTDIAKQDRSLAHYLPFLLRINGSVFPATLMYLRVKWSDPLRVVYGNPYVPVSTVESDFHFALDRPVTFQDAESVSAAIGHKVLTSFPELNRTGTRPLPSTVDFHLKYEPHPMLLASGAKVAVKFSVTGPYLNSETVLHGTLPIYAPLYTAIQGRHIIIANNSAPFRVLRAADAGAYPRLANPDVGDHYHLQLIATDLRIDGGDSESLDSQMLDNILKMVVSAFRDDNAKRLGNNGFNVSLTGYKGGVFNLEMNYVFTFHFSIVRWGKERSWNLWKTPSRTSLLRAMRKYLVLWRLPNENETIVVPA